MPSTRNPPLLEESTCKFSFKRQFSDSNTSTLATRAVLTVTCVSEEPAAALKFREVSVTQDESADAKGS